MAIYHDLTDKEIIQTLVEDKINIRIINIIKILFLMLFFKLMLYAKPKINNEIVL